MTPEPDVIGRGVIILSLGDQPAASCSAPATLDSPTTTLQSPTTTLESPTKTLESPTTTPVRVPVLACRDVLTAAGVSVQLITAYSDEQIDEVIASLDGPTRPDDLTWPGFDRPVLIVAASSDGQLRAVVRRMVRRYAPPPSRRPADLKADRTVADLPTIGVLPLDPTGTSGRAGPGRNATGDLVARLGLPRDPIGVAGAVLGGRSRRLDLFRTDAGSVTLHGALVGGVDASGHAAPWQGRVELDDIVLVDGQEPVLAVAVANANGYTTIDDVQLAPRADASSGVVVAGVAIAQAVRSRSGQQRVRIEVRRASGRAVSVTPSSDIPFLDDGVAGMLTRKRAWWVEAGVWGVFTV